MGHLYYGYVSHNQRLYPLVKFKGHEEFPRIKPFNEAWQAEKNPENSSL